MDWTVQNHPKINERIYEAQLLVTKILHPKKQWEGIRGSASGHEDTPPEQAMRGYTRLSIWSRRYSTRTRNESVYESQHVVRKVLSTILLWWETERGYRSPATHPTPSMGISRGEYHLTSTWSKRNSRCKSNSWMWKKRLEDHLKTLLEMLRVWWRSIFYLVTLTLSGKQILS